MFRELMAIGIVSLVAAFGAGCSDIDSEASQGPTQTASLLIRSPQGQMIATGTMSLPDPFPTSGSFSGTCQLVITGREFPPGATSQNGQCQGEVRDEKQVSINLNPGVMDNHINLAGQREGSRITGTCEISTFAGSRPFGTFELRVRSSAE